MADAKPADAVTQRPAPAYVPEIQGLRTIALLLVATFHIWFGKVSGGVDVFLLVSAYLMTRSLLHAAETGVMTRPVGVILHKFARILPLAAATVALTLVAAWLVLPARLWDGANADAFASATYWMNIHLQQAQVDYFRMDRLTTSAFQQFWSLSIQGQVFVLWPLLHVAAEWFARRTGTSLRALLLGCFAVIAAASFTHALWFTQVDQPVAYFDTWARLWEFAAGSIIAIVQPRLRIRAAWADALSWLGLVGVVTCGLILPVGSSFPGAAALWPVVSATLVLVCAGHGTRFGAGAVLGRGVLRWFGRYTYALYLVHWPILILALSAFDRPSTGPKSGLAIFAASVVLAIVLTHVVERPAARWTSAGRATPGPVLGRAGVRGLTIVVVSLLVGAGAAGVGDWRLSSAIAAAKAQVNETDYANLGAQAPDGPTTGALVPADLIMRMDGTPQGEPCAADDPFGSEICLVKGADPATSARTLLTIGSSHAMGFNNAIFPTLERESTWSLRTQMGPGCNFVYPSGGENICERLWQAATDYAIAEQPDLVMVVGTTSVADGEELVDERLLDWIDLVTADSPTRVVVVRDLPRFDFRPYDCAQELGFDAPECAGSAAPPSDRVLAHRAAVEQRGGIWVDLNDSICPDGTCPPSMGGVVTYLDDNHFTEAFGRSLGQKFTDQVAPSLDWWPPETFTR